MIRFKPGADADRLAPILTRTLPAMATARLEALERCMEQPLTITSAAEGQPGDGVHGVHSFHYSGYAVDLRTKDIVDEFARALRVALGAGWDVYVEPSHIHVERDIRRMPLRAEEERA